MLEQFIHDHSSLLKLDCVIVGGNFVNRYLNDYESENHAVIRNIPHIEKKRVKKLNVLIKQYKNRGISLLIADRVTDEQLAFDFVHELNAWLLSVCGGQGLYSYGFIKEWRNIIPSKEDMSLLDSYFIFSENNRFINDSINLLKKRHLFDYSVRLSSGGSFYFYKTRLNNGIIGYGGSFKRLLAQQKSIGEAIERLSVRSIDKSFISGRYNDLYQKNNLLDLSPYGHHQLRLETFQWAEATELVSNKKILIPAQLIYIDKKLDHEVIISKSKKIGSGGAGYFDRSTSIKNGIYELIERDCLMTNLLNNLTPARIKTPILIWDMIKKIMLERNLILNIKIYNISDDLKVPSYLVVLKNKHKNLDLYSVGIKANLDTEKAIYGAVEDALGEANYINSSIIDQKNTAEPKINYIYNYIKNLDKTNQEEKDINFNKKNYSKSAEIRELKNIFRSKKIKVIIANVTPDWLNKTKYFVYQTVIPQLQPLFFYPEHKEIRRVRLNQALKYLQSVSN